MRSAQRAFFQEKKRTYVSLLFRHTGCSRSKIVEIRCSPLCDYSCQQSGRTLKDSFRERRGFNLSSEYTNISAMLAFWKSPVKYGSLQIEMHELGTLGRQFADFSFLWPTHCARTGSDLATRYMLGDLNAGWWYDAYTTQRVRGDVSNVYPTRGTRRTRHRRGCVLLPLSLNHTAIGRPFTRWTKHSDLCRAKRPMRTVSGNRIVNKYRNIVLKKL